ncbi:HpcH/HpaI aldolase/citrate lyase family protein [Nereida sp. MMG025]|uniref:HpcH/HpaI aldolase family protein n=1 Tax=Nereida sp. MMG025 TaxID=2909981 RepID=UPI00351D46B3
MKSRLAAGEMQLGIWLASASPTIAELATGVGFDWCLIDAEHGPNTSASILAQLQAFRDAQPVVRVPIGQDWVIKQVLDLGAQSILVPMVNTGQQAQDIVAMTRYAPAGRRGLGGAVARATFYNQTPDYATTANDQICVMVQVETREALENLDEIVSTDGVDVVFIGPADLSADMGYLGQMDAPAVQTAIDDAIKRITATGKSAGIITFDPAEMRHYSDLGVTFLGVGSDVTTLSSALRMLAQDAKSRTSGE